MTIPSHTVTYSRMHDAFLAVADEHDTAPAVVRVLVALHDRGGSATSHELAEDLYVEGTMVRRALSQQIYARKWATGCGCDGGPRRTGVVSAVTLTELGRSIAAAFHALLKPVELSPVDDLQAVA